MELLNRRNILPYLQKFIFPHLDFVTKGELQEFKETHGGLVSYVYRLVVDSKPFYLKQVIPGTIKLSKVLKFPEGIDYIFNDQRQIYEARALRIFEKAVGYGVAPHIYYHDVKNKVLVISELLTSKAKLFEDIIHKEINLKASKSLAEIIVKLVNNTYGKIKPIRSTSGDKKLKLIKLRLQCLDVYSKLDYRSKRLVKEAQAKLVQESMKVNKVLVHGDYHPRNILIEGSKVGTVDLEEAHLGDPAFDIGILLGSYLLRADYHKNIRKIAAKSVIEMFSLFMSKVKIPEDKRKLEDRIKKHAGGLMLCRIDGFPSKWTKWVKRETAKKSIRKHATQIILDKSNLLSKVVKKIYYGAGSNKN